MKIGILTQPLFTNYGGILQNYALQRVLKDLGHEVYTIDRSFPPKSYHIKCASIIKYSLFRLFGEKKRIKRWLTKKEYSAISLNTEKFIDKYIQRTKTITNNKELFQLKEEYLFDAYMVGSDQVWRPKYSPNISNYFLDFVANDKTVRKIAYGASFGTDKWELSKKETSEFKSLLKNFDAVSVRENSAIDLCREFFDVDVDLVLDPTLLLSKEDYFSLISSGYPPNKTGNLFSYILDNDSNKNKIVNYISHRKKIKSIEVKPNKDIFDLGKYRLDDYTYPAVEKWIKTICEAEFVVTDSFHGTVFSILFNKPFISIINKERGATRFYSLTKLFGLEDRLIEEYSDKLDLIVEKPIDYKRVNAILEGLRQDSINFINNALKYE